MENAEIFHHIVEGLGIERVKVNDGRGFIVSSNRDEIAEIAANIMTLERNLFRLLMSVSVGVSLRGNGEYNVAKFCRESMIKMVESEYEGFLDTLVSDRFHCEGVNNKNQKVDA